jgi:hypothetical protein
LRLRIDARTALDRLAFGVPAPLLPRQTGERRTVGFMRVFVAGQAARNLPPQARQEGRGKLLAQVRGPAADPLRARRVRGPRPARDSALSAG